MSIANFLEASSLNKSWNNVYHKGISTNQINMNAGAINNVGSINGAPLPPILDFNAVNIIYRPGSTPTQGSNIVSSFSEVVAKCSQVNVNQCVNVYLDDSVITPCNIDQTLDCQGRVSFYPYKSLASSSVQVKILDGNKLINPAAFEGSFDIILESQTTNCIEISNGNVTRFLNGARILLDMSALVPGIFVTGQSAVLGAGYGSNFLASPSVSLIQADVGVTLIFSIVINSGNFTFLPNLISSVDSSASLIVGYDCSVNINDLPSATANFTGSIISFNINKAEYLEYNDSTQAPMSGSSNVQGVCDWLKTQISTPPTPPPYAGFQNGVYTPSTSDDGNSLGVWQDISTFILANTTHACVDCYLNDLNYLPPSGVGIQSDIDGGGRLVFKPFKNRLNNPLNVDLGNGLTLTDVNFDGVMVLRCDSNATENIYVSNGNIMKLRNCTIQPSATSSQPVFDCRNRTCGVFLDGCVFDMSLNPSLPLFDVGSSGNLTLYVSNSPNGANYNDLITGSGGNVLLVSLDGSLTTNGTTQSLYSGTYNTLSLNQAGAVNYDDSLVLPNLAQNYVQGAIDSIKSTYLQLSGGTVTGAVLYPDDVLGNPSISFSSSPTTGISYTSGNFLNFVVAGSTVLQMKPTSINGQGYPIDMDSGSITGLTDLKAGLTYGLNLKNSSNDKLIEIGNGSNKTVALYGVSPVNQATTAGVSSVFVSNSGTSVKDDSTFDGYTLSQVVKALRNIGILA